MVGRERLEHVVDDVEVERLRREVVVRGHQHDEWRARPASKGGRHLEAGLARHGDVEENRIWSRRLDEPHSRSAVGGRADHPGNARRLAEAAHPLNRERLVIDDHCAEGGGRHWYYFQGFVRA